MTRSQFDNWISENNVKASELQIWMELIDVAREFGARCFLAGTSILMADGSTKPIEDIRPGDEVAAFDSEAEQGLGPLKPGKVTRTFTNVTQIIINLRGLHMTPGHVVLMDNGEWDIIAKALKDDRAIVEERKDADGNSKAVLVRARAGAIFNHELLLEFRLHDFGQNARKHIRATASRRRDDHCHRARGIGLGNRRSCHQGQGEKRSNAAGKGPKRHRKPPERSTGVP